MMNPEELAVRMIFDPDSLRAVQSQTYLWHVFDASSGTPICSHQKVKYKMYWLSGQSVFEAMARIPIRDLCNSCRRKWEQAEWKRGSILNPRKEGE